MLQKTSNEFNTDIFELSKEEAERRNLEFELTDKADKGESQNKSNDKEKLRKWNWGAFLLAPVWTLANKLEEWTILCFVPFVNIGVMFYLGYNGNRLAFEKSKIESCGRFYDNSKRLGTLGSKTVLAWTHWRSLCSDGGRSNRLTKEFSGKNYGHNNVYKKWPDAVYVNVLSF